MHLFAFIKYLLRRKKIDASDIKTKYESHMKCDRNINEI